MKNPIIKNFENFRNFSYLIFCYNLKKGELKVFSGKGCATNPVTGKICDFDYVTSITGLEKIGETYQIHLNQEIDVENDQLLMTYRSKDEAVFAGMRVFVDLGGSYIVKDVLKMEGFPQRVSGFLI